MGGGWKMNWIIMNKAPADKQNFRKIQTEPPQNWRDESRGQIRQGNKFLVDGCTFKDILAFEDVCRENHYVVLIQPDPDSTVAVRAYFRPDRREKPRAL